jgi:hypothetical protein
MLRMALIPISARLIGSRERLHPIFAPLFPSLCDLHPARNPYADGGKRARSCVRLFSRRDTRDAPAGDPATRRVSPLTGAVSAIRESRSRFRHVPQLCGTFPLSLPAPGAQKIATPVRTSGLQFFRGSERAGLLWRAAGWAVFPPRMGGVGPVLPGGNGQRERPAAQTPRNPSGSPPIR